MGTVPKGCRLSTGTVFGLRATLSSVMQTTESAVKAVAVVLIAALRGARRATKCYNIHRQKHVLYVQLYSHDAPALQRMCAVMYAY